MIHKLVIHYIYFQDTSRPYRVLKAVQADRPHSLLNIKALKGKQLQSHNYQARGAM